LASREGQQAAATSAAADRQTARDGQIAERVTRAVDQLGSQQPQIAGIVSGRRTPSRGT
jgi:hypothetical protein